MNAASTSAGGRSTKASRRKGGSAERQPAKGRSETKPRALDLTPGFRDRLISSLDEVGIPPRGRMAYVSALTCRAAQTVSRWLDPRNPGLPDLESCTRLCDGLGRNSDWMLGLAQEPSGRDASVDTRTLPGFERVREMFDALRGDSATCDVVRMMGDEMAPRILDGDLMFVDRSADRIAGNGIYALQIDGRLTVRRVESRLGTGLVFKCENPAYEDQIVKDAAGVKRVGLRVVGKVRGTIGQAGGRAPGGRSGARVNSDTGWPAGRSSSSTNPER